MGSEWGQLNCWPSRGCRFAAAPLAGQFISKGSVKLADPLTDPFVRKSVSFDGRSLIRDQDPFATVPRGF
jgi:hypothetical protein